jgi:hypothetical protein
MSANKLVKNNRSYRAGGFGRPLFSARAGLIAALICASCGGSAGSAPDAPAAEDAARLYVREPASPALGDCGANRILVHPRGEALAVWRELPEAIGQETVSAIPGTGRIEIVNFASRRSGAPRPFVTMSPGYRLRPIAWAEDGSGLFALWQQATLVRLTSDGSPAATLAELDAGWSAVRITTARAGDAVSVMAAASGTMRRLKNEGAQGVLATFAGNEMRFAIAPALTGTALVLDGETRRSSAFPALLLRDHRILREPPGLVLYGEAAPGPADAAVDIGYRRPIVDLATGERVGSFGLRGIELEGPAARGLDALLRSLPRPYLLRDISVSGDSAALLYGDLNGEAAIALLRNGRAEKVTVCDFQQIRAANQAIDRGGPNPNFEVVDFLRDRANTEGPVDDPAGRRVEEIDFHRLDPATHAFGTLFAPRRNPGRRLVVYFHGGPAQSAIQGDITETLRRLDLLDADLMVFEYSGSAARDAALFRALPEHGPSAIDRDIAAFARWAEGRGYRQLHLIGASFGSLPVMSVLAAPRVSICSASLVAPALEWQDSTALAARRGGDRRGFMATRDAFARAAFGGEAGVDRLNAWLAQRRGSLGRPGVHLYFASQDILSARSQLPPEANRDDRVTVLNGSHVSVQQNPMVWSAIRRDIVAGCPGRVERHDLRSLPHIGKGRLSTS